MHGSGRRAKRRARTSTALLITASAVLAVIVSAGTVAFLHPWSSTAAQRTPLPAKVVGEQAVGLANLGPHGQAGSAATLLEATAGGLLFTPSHGGENVKPSQQWQADQMSGGGFVLLFTSRGQCLSALGTGSQATVETAHCDNRIDQRWYHPFQGTDSDGRDYWQLRNAANGECLAIGNHLQGVSVTAMQPCARDRPWQQLIMFWSAY